ncbi:hypothetical protein [Aedoeadaptatus pacaensis]|uniref:hypothetical protein n=1 Tax=Aedoeadaptatus pacaensis TaxID=1776390 RepID=UPI000838C0F4|nr:hypothetical protein [Peptoniphilus pacaensis]
MTVKDTDEQLVLMYRYLHNYTWEHIGKVLFADARTVRRWHKKAPETTKAPEHPIRITNGS